MQLAFAVECISVDPEQSLILGGVGATFQDSTEKVPGSHPPLFAPLGVVLGHLRFEAPLGGIGGGFAAIVYTAPVQVGWAGEPGLGACFLPEGTKQNFNGFIAGLMLQEQQNVEVWVEPVFAVSDFKGADGATNAQELA